MELEFSSDLISLLVTTGLTIYCFGWVLLKFVQHIPVSGQISVYFKEYISKILPAGHILFCIGFQLQQHVTRVIKRKEAPAGDETDHIFSLDLFIQQFKGGNTFHEKNKKPYAHHLKKIHFNCYFHSIFTCFIRMRGESSSHYTR
jgi:hypothetical protein